MRELPCRQACLPAAVATGAAAVLLQPQGPHHCAVPGPRWRAALRLQGRYRVNLQRGWATRCALRMLPRSWGVHELPCRCRLQHVGLLHRWLQEAQGPVWPTGLHAGLPAWLEHAMQVTIRAGHAVRFTSRLGRLPTPVSPLPGAAASTRCRAREERPGSSQPLCCSTGPRPARQDVLHGHDLQAAAAHASALDWAGHVSRVEFHL